MVFIKLYSLSQGSDWNIGPQAKVLKLFQVLRAVKEASQVIFSLDKGTHPIRYLQDTALLL